MGLTVRLRYSGRPFGAAVSRLALPLVLTLVALNTSFVVWTTSGLENPLTVLLASLLLAGLVRVIVRGEMGWGLPAALGALVAALGMTRPDGVVFFAAYPAALLITVLMRQPRRSLRRQDLRNLVIYIASFAALYGGFLVFRLGPTSASCSPTPSTPRADLRSMASLRC